MAKTTIDLTGRGGLTINYAGDLNDIVAAPNLRYLGDGTQVADGIYDPLRVLGYMAPANNTFTDLSGSITNEIVCRVYDSSTDTAFFGESDNIVQSINGLDDMSLAVFTTITDTMTLKDMELYQMNGETAVVYAYYANRTFGADGVGIGFFTTDLTKGMFTLSAKVYQTGVPSTEELISSGGDHALAQKFSTADAKSIVVSGIRFRIRILAPGQTWTTRFSIQTDSAGRPSGTVVSGTQVDVDPNTLPDFQNYYFLTFPTPVTLTPNTTYHIVIAPTLFSDLGGSDGLEWLRSDGANSLYANGIGEKYNGSVWADVDTTSESMDFALVLNNYTTIIAGDGIGALYTFNEFTAANLFLQKADNGFLYLFSNQRVSKFDGGTSGGDFGVFVADVLVFPKFLRCVDAVDTNSLMYIAIQSSDTSASTTSDYRTFGADTMGVYQWDRQSTVVNTRNFIPIYGAREIRRIFVNANGDLRVITIGEDRFTQIRGVVDGKLQVLYRLGINAYPRLRDSVDFMNNMLVWVGADGIFYACGTLPGNTTEHVYKIGAMGNYSSAITPGVLMVGNKESTQAREGIYVSGTDATHKKLQKWFPHGTGTINSIAQTGNEGDVFSLVTHLPYLSDVHHIMITCAPNGIANDATAVATIRFYKNMKTTEFMHKTVTRNDLLKGYLAYEINQSYMNALQIKIEWANQTLGSNDFLPAFAVLDYTATTTIK